MVNKIKIDDLLKAGYTEFKDHFKNADKAFQKRVGSTRYFINVYYYDWSQFSKIPKSEAYECDIQFDLKENDYLNLSFNCEDLTIDGLEAKVEWLFTTLGCIPYEKYD